MAVTGTPKLTAREVIDRIMADERLRASSHFSDTVYADEPILTTGRQMATFLPDRYREMRAISRWESGADGRPGRWLTEAELFYRQGVFMADFEDDCPYHGEFRSYFPTYNAMSDHQLRGYFTWRAAVRHGEINPTSLSFAFVYLYELINGIGVADPHEGFERFASFWQAYRVHAPEIDRYARVWLQDYAVYHGLDASMLDAYLDIAHDRAIIALRDLEPELSTLKPPRGAVSALPLPADEALEERLLAALDALSSYRITGSRLARTHRRALRHVCCGVWARLRRRYTRNGAAGALESLFGSEVTLPYSMFGSAVFFEMAPHPDADYELNATHRYACRQGRWSVTRFHDQASRSAKLGRAMRTADQLLREALGVPYPLKDTGKTPQYVQDMAKREVAAWMAWHETHAPRRISINRAELSGIRATAAQTREALLIDEERDGEGALVSHALGHDDHGSAQHEQAPSPAAAPQPTPSVAAGRVSEVAMPASPDLPSPDNEASMTYLRALLAGDRDAMARAVAAYDGSEDMLVDALNEACFDLLGDTAIEYTADGPALIEDYRADVEGALTHGSI